MTISTRKDMKGQSLDSIALMLSKDCLVHNPDVKIIGLYNSTQDTLVLLRGSMQDYFTKVLKRDIKVIIGREGYIIDVGILLP